MAATKNRGVLVATAQTVVDALDKEFDETGPPTMEAMGLVDRIGERQAQALDMTWMRKYRMWSEWLGERDLSDNRRAFQSRMYSRKFEDAVRIPIEDIEDGIEANFDPESEAQIVREGYENLVEYEHHAYFTHAFDDKYHGGTTTGPYGEEIYVGSMDGEPLLSDTHPYYEQIEFNENAPRGERLRLIQGGDYSNLVNDALTQDNLWKVVKNFKKLKHYSGRPANVGPPDTLVVGPELEQQAREILEKNMIFTTDGNNGAAATDNIVPDMDLRVDPWLTGTADNADFNFNSTDYTGKDIDLDSMWFVVNTQTSRSPFIHWQRKNPEVQRPVGSPGFEEDNPAAGEIDYLTFKEDAAYVGARARFGVSFGVPQVIYGSFGGVSL